ncbi:PEP/pyruvate-binding domain-containing protein [Auritidibacter ignavus]|uniref:PEP/pyruvate-binding domain-containing protein n=1 Tax=Auritidibacter ignavus TaxID=678932 RepID=UPI003211F45D
MLTRLSEATRESEGSKAGALGVLLRERLPVPNGFVVGAARSTNFTVGHVLRDAVNRELKRMGDPFAAVRSSSMNEDKADASAAGQFESIIGVRGVDDVCQAIETCRQAANAKRVGDYRARMGEASTQELGIATLVQPVVKANVSGVMFTPQEPEGSIRIESSWGLGLSVVGGTITPDTFDLYPDGVLRCEIGSKQNRVDLDHEHGGVVTTAVTSHQQLTRTLDDVTVEKLAVLGKRVAEILGQPQDIEWAIQDDIVWILQARPITAALPVLRTLRPPEQVDALHGVPGSHGMVTATARVVRSPSDFPTVTRDEILICPYTDPAWTPLFAVAAGVITETGGVLSHAAIVAREYGIPAVLGVVGATTRIEDGSRITIDGSAGTVTLLQPDQ